MKIITDPVQIRLCCQHIPYPRVWIETADLKSIWTCRELKQSVLWVDCISSCCRVRPASFQAGYFPLLHRCDRLFAHRRLGNSSVTYEVALFERGVEEVKSVGELVHVFVNRETGRPATSGMNNDLKAGLQKILVPQSRL
jgi:hypothetical protein